MRPRISLGELFVAGVFLACAPIIELGLGGAVLVSAFATFDPV